MPLNGTVYVLLSAVNNLFWMKIDSLLCNWPIWMALVILYLPTHFLLQFSTTSWHRECQLLVYFYKCLRFREVQRFIRHSISLLSVTTNKAQQLLIHRLIKTIMTVQHQSEHNLAHGWIPRDKNNVLPTKQMFKTNEVKHSISHTLHFTSKTAAMRQLLPWLPDQGQRGTLELCYSSQ